MIEAKPFLKLSGEDLCALARNGFTLHSTEQIEHSAEPAKHAAESSQHAAEHAAVPEASASGTATYLLHFLSDTGDIETFTATIPSDQQSLMNCLSGLDPVQVFVKLWNYREK